MTTRKKKIAKAKKARGKNLKLGSIGMGGGYSRAATIKDVPTRKPTRKKK